MIQYKEKIYAQALAEALLRGKNEDALEILFSLLKKTDIHKSRSVIALTEKLVSKKSKTKKIILETAREFDAKELIKNLFNEGDTIKEKINQDLIAGIRITINDEHQLDFSLKSKLEKVFNK